MQRTRTADEAGTPPVLGAREKTTAVWLLVACMAVAATAAVLPYVAARRAHPAEPVSVSVLYRDPAGDIQYYPLIAALARGHVRESMVKEEQGTRLHPFPLAGMAMHALGLAAAGPYGFAAADAVVFAGFFLSLFCFLRAGGVCSATAAVVALLATLGLSVQVNVGPHLHLGIHVWDRRIPRRFVSDVFAVAAFAVLARIVSDPAAAAPRWFAVLGTALALLIQSDVYAAFILSLSAALMFLPVCRCQGDARRAIRNMIAGGAAVALTCVPFVIQRLSQGHEIEARWGMFPVPRTKPLYWPGEFVAVVPPLCVFAAAYVITGAFAADLEPIFSRGAPQRFRRILAMLAVVSVIGHFAIPLSTMLLGKGVQIYHFPTTAADLDSVGLILCVAVAFDALVRSAAKRAPWSTRVQRRVSAAFLVTFLMLRTAALFRSSAAAGYAGHLRAESFQELEAMGTASYRADFAGLATYLSSLPHANRRLVLATFDHEVCVWWMSFNQGYSFLADPFISTVPDREIESRLASFCHLLRYSPRDYAGFIRDRSINWFWLSCDKYQASRAYTFSPPSDYTAEDRAKITRTTILDNWNVIVPRSEQQRLLADFEATRRDSPRRELDVIVLTNEKAFRDRAPPASLWRLSYRSPRFRVFVPLGDVSQPTDRAIPRR